MSTRNRRPPPSSSKKPSVSDYPIKKATKPQLAKKRPALADVTNQRNVPHTISRTSESSSMPLEATSSIQVVVTELSGFGTAILVNVINLGGEVGSVCSEGPWVFVGMPNVVKVWNTESGAEYSLNGPVGQVNALTAVKDLLFAGVEDGVILAWKGTNETNVTFQVASPICKGSKLENYFHY
uniref:Uncharacterized protein n=1 Tax=Fagus sylvatica TaxID=28930 RepID=A0A2N9GWS0_FAGSY